jgi:hypothetical protein
MAEFTGRERIRIAAGLCGWSLRTDEGDEDIVWLSRHRWIQIKYDRMGRILSALDHSQVEDGGPVIEKCLEPGPDRADQIIGWIARFR